MTPSGTPDRVIGACYDRGMLTCLRVHSLAIIDELEVELGPGLNVVTGETGAGKSILVTALQLVLGAKGRPEVVRSGAKRAEVEALFEIRDDVVRERLALAGIEAADELVIRRVVSSSGRARAYVNGQLAPAAQLKALAAGLADISSQHEHHTLVDPRTHLDYLDAFGKLEAKREAVARAHAALLETTKLLEELRSRHRARADREDLLRYQVQEIDALDPQDGELESLEEERARLRHAHKLASAAGGAEDALYAADDSLTDRLARIAAEVGAAAEIDPSLRDAAEQLETALSQLQDVARDLGRYARDVQVDDERLREVEDRLDLMNRQMRKYGGSVESILAHRDAAAEELDGLEHHEERLAAAESKRKAAHREASTEAHALREMRREHANTLGSRISEELASLGMGGARVEVALAALEGAGLEVDGARLTATGIDRAEFLIAPNKGEVARPLRKVASGGELSRAMLAIKRVLAGLGSAGLYVFDEVDSGVGGAVAEVIGKKLRSVAEHHQVLCITHLAQIAVHADTHFRVAKHVSGDRTYSEITRLDRGERLEEIARMVGGVKITKRTRAAAKEMLEIAGR